MKEDYGTKTDFMKGMLYNLAANAIRVQ